MNVQDILDQKNISRNKIRSLEQRRMHEFYEAYPEYAKLEEQKIELNVLMAKPLISASEIQTYKTQIADIRKRMDAFLTKNKISLPKVSFSCPKCEDTGYLKNAEKRFCSCVVNEIYTKIYGAHDVKTLPVGFEDFKDELFEQGDMLKIKKYLMGYAREYPQSRSLVLLGKVGLGKTFLLTCICKELAQRSDYVLFITAGRLFEAFWRDRLGEDIMINLILNCDVLILDDLGTEPMTKNVTNEYLFRLLDERQQKQNIIASNLSKEQLVERYSERVYSRMFNANTVATIELEGEDIRFKR